MKMSSEQRSDVVLIPHGTNEYRRYGSGQHGPAMMLTGSPHALSSTSASTLTPLSVIADDHSRVIAPPIEIKLFVGRVPRTFDDLQLRSVFAEFGTVHDVIIIRDRDTSAHKGCAFVRMASITNADLAIRSLNNIRSLDPSLGPLQVKYAFGEPERLGLLMENAQPGVDQAKLFVGSLPKTATDQDIHAVFSRFGDIDEVFVMKDDQKMSKGCAFVRFAFKGDAFSAIANLNGKFTMLGGTRAIEVRFAENKKAQQQQQQQQAPYVGGSAVSSALRPSSGWLEYVSPEGRTYYYSIQTGHTQWERPLELDAAPLHISQQPNVVPGGVGAQTHGPPGANVFIFHIPNDWSEHDLVSNFFSFGQIVSARIATDQGTGRRLGFGFVSFSTIEASIRAVMALDGFSVSGKRLKVTIKRGEEQYAAPFLPRGFSGQTYQISNTMHSIAQQSMGPNSMGPNSIDSMGPNSIDSMGPNSMGPNSIGPNSIGPNSIGPNLMRINSVGPISSTLDISSDEMQESGPPRLTFSRTVVPNMGHLSSAMQQNSSRPNYPTFPQGFRFPMRRYQQQPGTTATIAH